MRLSSVSLRTNRTFLPRYAAACSTDSGGLRVRVRWSRHGSGQVVEAWFMGFICYGSQQRTCHWGESRPGLAGFATKSARVGATRLVAAYAIWRPSSGPLISRSGCDFVRGIVSAADTPTGRLSARPQAGRWHRSDASHRLQLRVQPGRPRLMVERVDGLSLLGANGTVVQTPTTFSVGITALKTGHIRSRQRAWLRAFDLAGGPSTSRR
jgi:hypothetical protein